MTNRDIDAAWTYHNATKHSYRSVRTDPHFLDWANRPRPFKIYSDLKTIALAQKVDETGRPALEVINSSGYASPEITHIGVEDLTSIFYFAAGLKSRRSSPGGEIHFRAAACTGALYSVELYAVTGDLKNLEAGIYLFSPADFSLFCIRTGDYRGYLVHATAGEDSISHAPVTIVCTGTYWRNAWKYQSRTYRHFGWDNGTILANLLAITTARKLPAKVIHGFIDEEVNRLLDLDIDREVALNLIPVGYQEKSVPGEVGEVPSLNLQTLPYSQHEVDYPAMRDMHGASSLTSIDEVAGWRGEMAVSPLPSTVGVRIPLTPNSGKDLPEDSIETVINRRGSSRVFSREPIRYSQLSTALFLATQGVPADFVDPPGIQINDIYIICHAVTGVAPGAYVLHRRPWALELLKEGNFRSEAGYLGLEQAIPADCSAAIFFMTDLNPHLERFGNRGYRAVQLEAGIIGGRLYLAAYAQRVGATGLTFYDDDVTEFFSPHAKGKSAIFLVALGKKSGKPIRTFL